MSENNSMYTQQFPCSRLGKTWYARSGHISTTRKKEHFLQTGQNNFSRQLSTPPALQDLRRYMIFAGDICKPYIHPPVKMFSANKKKKPPPTPRRCRPSPFGHATAIAHPPDLEGRGRGRGRVGEQYHRRRPRGVVPPPP